MDELWHNVLISYDNGEGGTNTLYANVSDGQREMLGNRDDLVAQAAPDHVVMSVWAQLTPTGDISPRIIHLDWVTGVDFWEPGLNSGLARDFPNRL
jgi:hypothetical protein